MSETKITDEIIDENPETIDGSPEPVDETPKNEQINAISIDDGSERVPILNRRGDEIGVFYFRPTDIGLISRYNKIAKDFAEITAPLENINIAADGTAESDNEAEIKALKEAEERLYKAVDYLFDGNLAEAFFGKMHPFSPVNGAFYCEAAITAVGTYVAKRFDTEVSRIQRNVNRYTHGYQARTGKHKNGKK